MRFYNFFLLENENKDNNSIIQTIKKDCVPFLKERALIYRGISDLKDFNFKKFKVNKNRKPRKMPKIIHELLDDGFNSLFGFNARSDAVFCTGDFTEAEKYGKVYNIFPIGDFKYCWSKNVKDIYNVNFWYFDKIANTKEEKKVLDLCFLFFYYNDNLYELKNMLFKNSDYFKNYFDIEKWSNFENLYDIWDDKNVKKEINSFVKYVKKRNSSKEWIKFHEYTNKDLEESSYENGEIMINCDEFYLANTDFVLKNYQRIYNI